MSRSSRLHWQLLTGVDVDVGNWEDRVWSRAASLLPGRGMAAFPKRWPEPADLFTAQFMPFWHRERTADSDEVTSSTRAIQLEVIVAKPESGRSVRISGLANGKFMVAMPLSGSRYSKSTKAIRLPVKRKEMYFDSMN